MNNLWAKRYEGKKIYIPESEVDDDIIKRFLVGLLLNNEWAEDFEPVHIAIKFSHSDTVCTPHITDYLHINKRFLKDSSDDDYRFAISVNGRKWLDKHKGGKYEQQDNNSNKY